MGNDFGIQLLDGFLGGEGGLIPLMGRLDHRCQPLGMDKGGIRDKCLLSKGQCMAKGYMFVKKQK